jgi:phage baseplate assembly protein V
VLTETVHQIDAETGYTVTFSSAPPQPVRRRRTPLVTHGEVAAIDDPDGLGRCRVALTSFGKLPTGWLQVLVPGAGKGKGLAVLPELGDGVMVLLPDGDPAQGFVLGGLYGEQRLPRGAAVQRDRPFVLRTAGGQGLELGRDTPLARLSTSGGSLVELTPRQMRLAAASDLLIEAPGKVITIRADAIRFEQG